MSGSNHIGLFSSGENIPEVLEILLKPYLDNDIPVHLTTGEKIQNDIEQSDLYWKKNIQILDSSSTYGISNSFDRVIARDNLQELINSYSDPFVLIGEIQSLDDYQVKMDSILEYEQEANEILKHTMGSAYCLYNTDELDEEELERINKHHPYNLKDEDLLTRTKLEIIKNTGDFTVICMICKKSKHDKDWEYTDPTILPLNSKTYSHGICEKCVKNYPEIF